MPTTRGWAALGIGLALPILWVAFGENVMLAVGTFLILAVASGIIAWRSASPRVAVSRSSSPVQVATVCEIGLDRFRVCTTLPALVAKGRVRDQRCRMPS